MKKNHWVPSQDYTVDDSSNRCLSAKKCSRFIVVKSDPSSAVGLLFCVFLVVWLRHVQIFQKNGTICLRVQLLLDLAHLETPIQSTAVYFRAHTRKSIINNLSRCHKRVSKHRVKFSCNIELMPIVASISRKSHDDLAISACAQHQ